MITGATGFVGGHVVDQLLAQGDEVTALVRSMSKAEPLARRGVRLVQGGLADHASVAAAMVDQEIVYHIAALTGAGDERSLQVANLQGTASIADAAMAAGSVQRVVLVSSMAAGGPAELSRPCDGTDPDRPVTMYGRSKLASEQIIRACSVPWTILRPPTVYGPGDYHNLLAVFRAARRGFAPIFGDGSMPISVIHVTDLAHAVVIAASAADVVGKVFYVNHPEVTTSGGLVRAVAKAVGRDVRLIPLPRWLAHTALTFTGAWATLRNQQSILHPDKIHEFFQVAWTGNPQPFIAATGWQPEYDLERGLTQTAAWYRAQGLI
jgi:nucleoside-diphosphate-sugar epimerase